MSALIEFHGFNKFYGAQQVLDRIDLQVQSGEVLVILGPSGCGKVLCCVASMVWKRPTAAA